MKRCFLNINKAAESYREIMMNVIITLILVLSLSFQTVMAHDITVDRGENESDYKKRLARLHYLEQHKMSEGLRHRAAHKVERTALEAAGIPPAEAARKLFGDLAFAFPFMAPAELKSKGTVRTLTVLVDFKDHRANNRLPSRQDFLDNIYGNGTHTALTHVPYESVHAYYNRASEGIVDLQGEVLDWYQMPKNRNEYEPETAPPGPFQNRNQMLLDNKALFDIAVEVLSSQDANHDFSQYDNDNDGDIDLMTILYTGPRGRWNSFWWAYRWEFFVPEASTVKFDGKRLKQFVFQFIDTWPFTNDFNPTTLIHEMGHAFGLADYYDYDPTKGTSGGVGGLDMMDGNWGNHSAFSRWLLDWIVPEVIGSGLPSPVDLVASGTMPGSGTKAIVVFPDLIDTDAPSGEMFIIENRYQTGNDGHTASTPGNGLLIWHVDATVNFSGDDFKYDNSYTDHKLVRLVRADSSDDFNAGERATSSSYFGADKEFTPTSTPASNRVDGTPSNVTVKDISPPNSTMTASIGIAQDSRSAQFVSRSSVTASTPVGTSTEAIDFAKLGTLSDKLATATPAEIQNLWQSFESAKKKITNKGQAVLTKQMILTRWASKSGKEAVEALLDVPDTGFVRRTYPEVMTAWATNDAAGAADWYFDEEQAELRASEDLKAGTKFTQQVFAYVALDDQNKALTLLDSIKRVSEIYSALVGIQKAAAYQGTKLRLSETIYQALNNNRDVVKKLEILSDTIREIDVDSLENRRQRDELKQFLHDNMLQ